MFKNYSLRDAKADSIASLIAYRYRQYKHIQARNIPLHDRADSTRYCIYAAVGTLALISFTTIGV